MQDPPAPAPTVESAPESAGPPPAPRRRLWRPIRVELLTFEGKARFLAYAGNLSSSGAFLACSAPRPTGSRLRVRLHLPEAPGGWFACEALVIWSRGYAGRHGPAPGMGVRFTGLDPAAEKALRVYCE